MPPSLPPTLCAATFSTEQRRLYDLVVHLQSSVYDLHYREWQLQSMNELTENESEQLEQIEELKLRLDEALAKVVETDLAAQTAARRAEKESKAEIAKLRAGRMLWAKLVKGFEPRSEKSMALRLAGELLEASEGRGGAMKKRDEVHRMAEANKAFSHFRF